MDALEYYSAVLASIDSPVICVDCDGTVVFFNKSAEKNLGYAAGEVVGKATLALWHVEEELVRHANEQSQELGAPIEPGLDALTQKAKLGIRDAESWTFVRKNGSRFTGRLAMSRLLDRRDEISGYVGVIEDLAELQRVRRSLLEAKDFSERIYNRIPDILFVKDQEFRIIQANEAFLSLYPPETRDQVIGTTTIEAYDQEEADAFLENDKLAFASGESQTIESIQFPNGTKRILETRKIRFEDKGGARFILGVSRDVGEREALLEKLRRTNEELQEFTYRISHDLRAPLVSSTRLVQLARRSMGDNAPADEMLRYAEQSLGKLEALVQEILVLARAGSEEEEPCVIDVPSLVTHTLKALSHLDNYDRLEIRTDLRFAGTLRAKPRRLAVILENMVSNAIKYQDPAEACPSLSILASAENGSFVLQVDDNGLGIAEAHRKDIFLMFKRFHPKAAFGSGLGLYIVKTAAIALGGDVSFQPREKGSSFQLRIPTQEKSP